MAGLYGGYNGNNPLVAAQQMYNGMQPQSPMAFNSWNNNYNNYTSPNLKNQNNGVIWVNGVEGAKAYIIQPNTSVVLMDSEQNYFYLKSANEAGIASIRTFEFQEKQQETKSSQGINNADIDEKLKNYVPRKEFDEIKEVLVNLTNNINNAINSSSVEKPKYVEKKEG